MNSVQCFTDFVAEGNVRIVDALVKCSGRNTCML